MPLPNNDELYELRIEDCKQAALDAKELSDALLKMAEDYEKLYKEFVTNRNQVMKNNSRIRAEKAAKKAAAKKAAKKAAEKKDRHAARDANESREDIPSEDEEVVPPHPIAGMSPIPAIPRILSNEPIQHSQLCLGPTRKFVGSGN